MNKTPGKKKMNSARKKQFLRFYHRYTELKGILFAFLGLACGIYFIICLLYGGFSLSWIFIWPAFMLFFLIRAVILYFTLPAYDSENCDERKTASRKYLHVPLFVSIFYRIVFLLLAGIFIWGEAQIISAMNKPEEKNLPYVIVLGAGLKGSQPTRPMLLRMEKAYEYMAENPDTVLVASGGQGPDEAVSEGDCICNYLVNRGIDKNRIIVERMSTSTEENIRFSYMMLPDKTARTGILSNGFHLYRALRIARLQGHDNVTGIPSKTLLPLGIHYTVREFFGCSKLMLQQLLLLLSP